MDGHHLGGADGNGNQPERGLDGVRDDHTNVCCAHRRGPGRGCAECAEPDDRQARCQNDGTHPTPGEAPSSLVVQC